MFYYLGIKDIMLDVARKYEAEPLGKKIMKSKYHIIILFVLLFCSAESGQTTNGNTKVFDKDGLSFSYAAGWELTDQSTAEMQQLKLTAPNSNALIYINSPIRPITTEAELKTAQTNIFDRFAANILQKFKTENAASGVQEEAVCSALRGKSRTGKILRGIYATQPTTAEIAAAIPEHRFINLVFIRGDAENDQLYSAWKTIIKTIKTVTPNAENLPPPPIGDIVHNSIEPINGKAVKLPIPFYPKAAQDQRAAGEVLVSVVIDETGKVIFARGISGNAFLRAAAEQAARRAVFNPTYICDDPVQVKGVIRYYFEPIVKKPF